MSECFRDHVELVLVVVVDIFASTKSQTRKYRPTGQLVQNNTFCNRRGHGRWVLAGRSIRLARCIGASSPFGEIDTGQVSPCPRALSLELKELRELSVFQCPDVEVPYLVFVF